MEMNYEKALRILGLSSSFTEEDLKKAYRTEAKKYHPDNYSKVSSEEQEKAKYKMQEINAAYEFIIKYRKNNVRNEKNTRTNNDELDKLKKQMIDKLNSYLNYDKNKNYDSIFDKYLNKVRAFIMWFNHELEEITTKDEVTKITNLLIRRMKDAFTEMKHEFYFTHNIPYSFVTNFNYECSIGEFYEQLLEVLKNYNDSFKNRILQETEKYKSYTGYDELESVIKDIINKAANSTNDIDEVIKNLHEDIERVFKNHFEIKAIFNKIRDYLLNHPNRQNNEYLKVLDNLNKLEKEYQDTKQIAFGNLNKFVQEFNYYKNKNELSNNKEIKDFYQTFIETYHQDLLNLDPFIDQDKIRLMNKTLDAILDYFNKIKDGKVTLEEALKTLKSFTNGNYNSFTEHQNKSLSGVYIKIKQLSFMDDIFYLLVESHGLKLMFNHYGRVVSDKEIESDYISIEEFLEKAEYVGKRITSSKTRTSNILKHDAFILYRNDDIVIFNDMFGNLQLRRTNEFDYTLSDECVPIKGKDYKDKNELINDIKEKLENMYKRYLERNEENTKNFKPKY